MYRSCDETLRNVKGCVISYIMTADWGSRISSLQFILFICISHQLTSLNWLNYPVGNLPFLQIVSRHIIRKYQYVQSLQLVFLHSWKSQPFHVSSSSSSCPLEFSQLLPFFMCGGSYSCQYLQVTFACSLQQHLSSLFIVCLSWLVLITLETKPFTSLSSFILCIIW